MVFSVPITGSMVVGAVAVVVWYFTKDWIEEARKKRKSFEDLVYSHIALCGEKSKATAVMELQICNIEEKVDKLDKNMDEIHKAIFDHLLEDKNVPRRKTSPTSAT